MSDPNVRTWTAQHYQPDDADQRIHPTDREVEQWALAALRALARDAGYIIRPATLTRVSDLNIRVGSGGAYDVARPGEPRTGVVSMWKADAEEQQPDSEDLTGDVDGEGDVWFNVAGKVPADGGDLRLRHDLDGDVTVTAYANNEAADQIGYEFAATLDDNVVVVALVGGTGAVQVTRDEDREGACRTCGEPVVSRANDQWVHRESGIHHPDDGPTYPAAP